MCPTSSGYGMSNGCIVSASLRLTLPRRESGATRRPTRVLSYVAYVPFESARFLPVELEDLAESLGAPRYRGRQIATWLYAKGATDITAMSDLPREFRSALSERAEVAVPEIERQTPSQDGSQKLVLRLGDGARIQSVLMPDEDRLTLCVSTQVGCGFG